MGSRFIVNYPRQKRDIFTISLPILRQRSIKKNLAVINSAAILRRNHCYFEIERILSHGAKIGWPGL